MREIIWSESFNDCVAALGGAEAIDRALDPLMDALYRNPYGFEKFENDWTSFRCARTKAIGYDVTALVLVFSIDQNKNVVLQWIEEDIPF